MENQAKQKIDLVIHGLMTMGGLWAAIFAPIAIIVVAFIIPFADAATLTYLLKLFESVWFKWFLFFMIILPIWYGLGQILSTLGHMTMELRRGSLLFYGLAFAWSAHVGYVLFILE